MKVRQRIISKLVSPNALNVKKKTFENERSMIPGAIRKSMIPGAIRKNIVQ